jgi:predicted AAA+ superfamily ATPase
MLQSGSPEGTLPRPRAIVPVVLCRVEPWFQNQLKRLLKTPKLHVIDAGLPAVTVGAAEERVAKDRFDV